MSAKRTLGKAAEVERELLTLLSQQVHPVEVHLLVRLLSRRFTSGEVVQALEALKSRGLVAEDPPGYVKAASFFDQGLVERLRKLSGQRRESG